MPSAKCPHCKSGKPGQSAARCQNPNHKAHCGVACLTKCGCLRLEEAFAKRKAQDAIRDTKEKNTKTSKKRSEELSKKKKTENDALFLLGVDIEASLSVAEISVIAERLVEDIKEMVPLDHGVYVFISGSWRIKRESFASLSARGCGKRLVMKAGGYDVEDEVSEEEMKKFYLTATEMTEEYDWVCVESLYESTSAVNMNEVEKKVHQLLFEDRRSIWLRNGMGGVHLDNDGLVLKFSLSIIHGPRTRLDFAAEHPRALA